MNVEREVLALAVTFAGAGFLAGTALVRERLGAGNRLLLSLALSVPATLLVASPAIATHSLAAWNVLAGLAALAMIAAWRRRRSRRRLPARPRAGVLRAPRLPGRARLLSFALVVLAAVVTWFAVLVPQGAEQAGNGHPNGTIVYYHWGIVSKVVAEGGLPATLTEWGKPREFPYEYAFSVLHAATTANLTGGSGFVLEEHYRLALVVFAFCAALALWRRWLPPWWAWLAAVLTMNVSRVETRLLVYKPEAFAFVLVLWSAWLLDEALERRSPRWGALAGAVLATSFLAHPIGSLLIAPLWGGILIARGAPVALGWLRGRRGGADVAAGHPETSPLADAAAPRPAAVALRSALPSLRTVAVAVLVFAALFGGLRTVIGHTGQDLSQSAVDGVDLTRVVYNLGYVSADPFARPPVPECDHPFGVYSSERPFFASPAAWFYFDLHALPSALLIAGGLLAALGALLLRTSTRLGGWPAAARRGALTWICYGAGVYLLARLICLYYSTWVPQRVGPMRLMPYWALVFPGLIAGLAWAAAELLGRRWPGRPPTAPVRRPLGGIRALAAVGRAEWFGASVAVLPALALSAAVLLTFTAIGSQRDPGRSPFRLAAPRAGGLAPGARRAYRWISRHLPDGALILTNGYVEGALAMTSHRSGLLDGRAPFAQPDPWRAEAIELMERSRAFFAHPARHRPPGGATFVLAGTPDVNLGGTFFPTDFTGLRRDADLRLAHRFPGVDLFAVRSPTAPISPRSARRYAAALLAHPPARRSHC